MIGIPTFDLLSDRGKQEFIEYMVNLTRKEINSYTPSYNTNNASVTTQVNNYFGNLDGGLPDSTYGGISPIDLGGVT
jgi:hypothetical protein